MHGATEADQHFQRDFEFREKVGCILYYMICMRPDICDAVGLMAKQCNRVTKAAVTQLMQYCYNTRFEKLVLGGKQPWQLRSLAPIGPPIATTESPRAPSYCIWD
jgi:hypothetical protein